MIGSLKGTARLKELAGSHLDASIQMSAVTHCGDDELIKELAVQDASSGVRIDAAKQVQDQQLLFEIATRDKDESVRKAAGKQLRNTDLVFKILSTPENMDLRLTRLSKIIDPVARAMAISECRTGSCLLNVAIGPPRRYDSSEGSGPPRQWPG